MQGKELKWGRMTFGDNMVEEFKVILSMYSDELEKTLAFRTCKGMVSIARQFLRFLEDCGKTELELMTADDVKQFLTHKAQSSKNSMKHTIERMTRFFFFLNSTKITDVKADRHLAMPARRHVKLLPCFMEGEVSSILAAVDASTSVGKRDFAILLLAARLGLRCSDILGLKLSDIDWRKGEIQVLQSKTGTYEQLPLMQDVGDAIADYIIEVRPQCDNPYIFLRSRMPHDRLKTGTDIIGRYLPKTSIAHEAGDGKSFHALRRSVGTRLVKANIPLPTVAQVLMHNDIDSSKRYISLNDEALRICCLDISEYATRKRGLMS